MFDLLALTQKIDYPTKTACDTYFRQEYLSSFGKVQSLGTRKSQKNKGKSAFPAIEPDINSVTDGLTQPKEIDGILI